MVKTSRFLGMKFHDLEERQLRSSELGVFRPDNEGFDLGKKRCRLLQCLQNIRDGKESWMVPIPLLHGLLHDVV